MLFSLSMSFCMFCWFICCFQFYIPHISEIMWFFTFSNLYHLAWYSQGSSMAAFHLFLCQSYILLCICTTSLPSHLLRDTLVVSVSWSPWKCCSEHTRACMLENKCFQIIWVEEGLLSHKVALLFIFWGTSILFPIVAVPVYIPTSNKWRFLFPHHLSNTCNYLSCW